MSPVLAAPSVVTDSVCGMISTENVSSVTSLTVSETPSSATEPLVRDEAHQLAAARASVSRAMSVRSSRATSSAMPSTWPRDDMAAELVADLQRALEIEPRALLPAPGRGHPQRLGGGIDRKQVRLPPLAGLDHGQADAGMRDRGADGDRGARIGAGDLEPAQAFGPRLDRDHLADIGDDAGEHR